MYEINKESIVDIVSLGYEGEGIAKIDWFPIFIPGALIGEKVKVKIVKAKKNYANAKLIEIIERSIERREPKCKNFKRCGGCTLKHLNYKGQLDFKFNRVKDCISKIAGIDENIVKYTLGMEEPYGYRNKVQFPVGLVDGKIVIKF